MLGASYLGRCARAPGGGQSGGGQGTGAAPCFLAPLRRRSRRREEPVPVCAGELLASGPQGWRPTPWSGPASGGPAPRPRCPRLASLPVAQTAALA